jgi:hypothetical protein
MLCRVLADLLVVIHFAFVLFVLLGGMLVWRHRWVAWLHIPAAVWGALIEFNSWVCPLTPWEQRLRACAGQTGYGGGFIDHYLLPVLYPGALTPGIQDQLGLAVIAVNVLAYGAVLRHRRAARASHT